MLLPACVLALAYAALLLRYAFDWSALPEWQLPAHWQPTERLTVLVPARDEEGHLDRCLQSLLNADYPHNLLEIMVLDDFSADATPQIAARAAAQFPAVVRLLRLADHLPPEAACTANKKAALTLGVAQATGLRMVTTDADCSVPPDWLRLHAFVGGAQRVVAAPVLFEQPRGVLGYFQALDFIGLMGITGAGIQGGYQRMGNGANLSYPKVLFEAVGGYAGNAALASGDDLFLLQQVAARDPEQVVFLKNAAAAVLTPPMPTWGGFVQQRLRWGTKNAALPEWPIRLALLAVFLFCWSILISGLLALFFMKEKWLYYFAFQALVKGVANYLFLRMLCRYFQRGVWLNWFLPAFLLHTLYVPLLGTASLLFKKYRWKGRVVR